MTKKSFPCIKEAEISTIAPMSKVPELLAEGRRFLQASEFTKTAELAKHAHEIAPKHQGPILLLAQVLEQREGPQSKIDFLMRFLETVDDNVPLRRQLVEAHLQTGQHGTARALAEGLIEDGVETFWVHLLLGRCALAEGLFEQAKPEAERALEMAPGGDGAILMLARIAELEGGLGMKAAVLKDHLNDARGSFSIRLNLAGAYMNQNMLDQATAIAQTINLDKCSDRQVLLVSGMFEMCGRTDLSKDCYRHIDPKGALGSAVLLSDVIRGTISSEEALSRHAIYDLPKDNFYKVLLAYAKKQSPYAIEVEEYGAQDCALDLLRPYLNAPGYFFSAVTPASPIMVDLPKVTILAPIHRAEDEENLLRQMVRQDYANLEAVVVVNGPGISYDRIYSTLERSGNFCRIHVKVLPFESSLPVSLNYGLSQAHGDYIARFDADDLYLERYISRSISFMRTMSADVCGKPHIVIHFEDLACNIVVAFKKQSYTPMPFGDQAQASGSTLIISRSVAEKLKFDEALRSGEDIDFYHRCFNAGFRIVHAPLFDHIVLRRKNKGCHTWKLGDVRLLLDQEAGFFLSQGTPAAAARQLNQFLDQSDI